INMYQPSQFKEERLEVLHGLVQAHPFGTLVTQQDGGLTADHLPFVLDPPTANAPFGILRGHVARANPLWHAAQTDTDALAIFQGPHAYITPAWYEEKALTGKVVPTYNYAVVHAHGRVRAVEDPVWLRALLDTLTATNENRRAQPWAIADAPPDYIEKMMSAIVGIEIVLARVTGKWKVSQNRSAADRANVAAGLAGAGEAGMAQLVRG
ncbi:MAG TPA: FMN-binding negative transcriptional regulator, partial [Burkholderiaceae bacterium]